MVTAGGFCSSTEPVQLHTHFRPCCNPAVSPLIFGCPTGIGQRSHRSQQGAFGSDIGTKDGSYLSCTCLQKGISVPVFSVKSVTATSRCISHTMDTDNANTAPLCQRKIQFCFIKKLFYVFILLVFFCRKGRVIGKRKDNLYELENEISRMKFIASAVGKEGIGLCCHWERSPPSPPRAGTLLHIVTFCLVAAGTGEENLQ